MSWKDIKVSDWINKETRPLQRKDYEDGLADALPTDNYIWNVYTKEDNIEALEWLKGILYGPQGRGNPNINFENFDKEFKKILKTANKEFKEGGELASYYPTVKKAIMYIRRAIEHRWGTRVMHYGHSSRWYPGVKKPKPFGR